ncbi:MAG TPA: 2-oxoacid:acceptor oxidoreductase subunit alpha [Flavobacteriales bacterium]|jgi:2-oxoglutarate ferredoxin oxidoreductase subunit alpha|nr:2-oxoacid:acceptor oxidoreductase subunit alpha [Flavobacteriales bacterium]
MESSEVQPKDVVSLEKVVIKFAGDSGDGMQFTGAQFTGTSAILGNDIATFPDYPAEIRAPQGTVAGVSGFQVHIGHAHVHTPGDSADLLVAMNAAALKANLKFLPKGRTVIVDTDNFKRKDWEKAGFENDPLESDLVKDYHVVHAPITSLTRKALEGIGLDNKSITRSKNMFALGMVYWLFSRPLDYTERYLEGKFGKVEKVLEANIKALKAGYFFAETIEALPSAYSVLPADMEKGTYKNLMGNEATAWGFFAAAEKAGLELFLGSYPITPASEILHEIAKYKHFGAKAFQAEDEIAGIVSAIGASFAGDLAVTTTSGPGLALKSEAIGLAVITELPLVIVNVQRGGPSTGLPTKTEQSDLLQALYGRNGESPVAVIAARSPADCFHMAFEASKLALEHVTPVILLTDGYVANGSQPWKIQRVADLPEITPRRVKTPADKWEPYLRDENSLAREWAVPGMKGYEHRIGGLEKDALTGDVSYDPENHEEMIKTREEKIARMVHSIPELKVDGDEKGELLVVGWGGTYGSLLTAQNQCFDSERRVSLAHFQYLNPLPKNTEEVFSRFKKIVVCELNNGQLAKYLKTRFPQFEYLQYNKIQGLPFTVQELTDRFKEILSEN